MKSHTVCSAQGFTLVEMLLAIALSSLVTLILISAMLSIKSTYAISQGLAHVQENARLASTWLQRDIRMAGFIGCPRITDALPNGANILPFSHATRLLDFTYATHIMPWLKLALPKSLVADSDVMLVQMADSHVFTVLFAQGEQVTTADASGFKPAQYIVIADCEHADVAEIASIHGKRVTLKNKLLHVYANTTTVSLLHQWLYYVAKTSRKNQSGHAICALYRRDLLGPATTQSELVEGVDQLKVNYGIKNLQDGNVTYFSKTEVPDWNAVASVHIALLLDSIDSVLQTPQRISFQGKTWQALDRRLYREWDVSVALREP